MSRAATRLMTEAIAAILIYDRAQSSVVRSAFFFRHRGMARSE